jgi:cytochrome c oxidase assembly protein subunit 15
MPVVSRLIARLPMPSRTAARTIGIAAIVSQAGIGVTGSVVRVTGSGLGCPTWPQCFPGSLVPEAHPEFHALNQWIEFTNRMLISVVGVVAALCLLAALRIRHEQPGRRRLVRLAWVMPLGVVAQAVIGGMTVLTGLLWWTVALHFLASALMVWLATLLLAAFTEGDEQPRWYLPPAGRGLLKAQVAVLAALLVAGTTVTGAGPHGGDPNTPRLRLPIETLATVHGSLLVTFLVLLAAVGVAVHRRAKRLPPPAKLWRRYAVLVVVALAQGTLGSVQYALGVPETLVSFHVLGSSLVVIATAALWCAARDRGPSISDVEHAETRAGATAAASHTPA